MDLYLNAQSVVTSPTAYGFIQVENGVLDFPIASVPGATPGEYPIGTYQCFRTAMLREDGTFTVQVQTLLTQNAPLETGDLYLQGIAHCTSTEWEKYVGIDKDVGVCAAIGVFAQYLFTGQPYTRSGPNVTITNNPDYP